MIKCVSDINFLKMPKARLDQLTRQFQLLEKADELDGIATLAQVWVHEGNLEAVQTFAMFSAAPTPCMALRVVNLDEDRFSRCGPRVVAPSWRRLAARADERRPLLSTGSLWSIRGDSAKTSPRGALRTSAVALGPSSTPRLLRPVPMDCEHHVRAAPDWGLPRRWRGFGPNPVAARPVTW